MISFDLVRCTEGSFPGRTPAVDNRSTVRIKSADAAIRTKTNSIVDSFGFCTRLYPPTPRELRVHHNVVTLIKISNFPFLCLVIRNMSVL